jgi:hypothetical protein
MPNFFQVAALPDLAPLLPPAAAAAPAVKLHAAAVTQHSKAVTSQRRLILYLKPSYYMFDSAVINYAVDDRELMLTQTKSMSRSKNTLK